MVVVLDSATYKTEAMRQLLDVSTYQPLSNNPSQAYKEILVGLIDLGFTRGIFSAKIRDYLLPKHPRIPIFHHLPKVHKKERPPIGRPIVSGIGSLNERLSELIDLYLQPLVQRLTSFVQDTKHVLQIIDLIEWDDTFAWATIDVASLYSCIPHDRGLTAISYHLERYSTYDVATQNFILNAIDFLLTHNFFKFDGTFYLQKCGTSMGAKFAPTYANLYMGWWEESHIYGDTSGYAHKIVLYKRYVDDLLLIWCGTEGEFTHFVDKININDLNLKFTYEFHKQTISFLDLSLTIRNTRIDTSIFRKTCSGNSLLRADSCHPSHLFKGIPLGQFIRLRRNCNTDKAFLEQSLLLRDRFLERGYTHHSLSLAFTKALRTERTDLLTNTNKVRDKIMNSKDTKKSINNKDFIKMKHDHFNNNDLTNLNVTGIDKIIPTFVTSFSSQFYKIKHIVNTLIPVLYNDPDLATLLHGGCRVVARKAPTLGNILSPTLWSSQPKKDKMTWLRVKGTYTCGASKCITCAYIKQSTNFQSTVTGKIFEMPFYANCNTKFVVYLFNLFKLLSSICWLYNSSS
ncbi:uncharacterized protein LOC116408410 [Xenopus tropicalis]|uniref:Uncharacterized protein LOC116408410 n=1 Tax=Xenopus tropicalis TaxID=8364 RepID=A0A8J1IZR5_XENTR|nr:uncharacterized protein LOC116408410 [Xenopus tropicalis]